MCSYITNFEKKIIKPNIKEYYIRNYIPPKETKQNSKNYALNKWRFYDKFSNKFHKSKTNYIKIKVNNLKSTKYKIQNLCSLHSYKTGSRSNMGFVQDLGFNTIASGVGISFHYEFPKLKPYTSGIVKPG